ncbi:hypothetical protein VB10N_46920 [Vibrio sp. 10N]|nr:hypothetical protein VB10N_46920 [Vibrio sp. 10N]
MINTAAKAAKITASDNVTRMNNSVWKAISFVVRFSPTLLTAMTISNMNDAAKKNVPQAAI